MKKISNIFQLVLLLAMVFPLYTAASPVTPAQARKTAAAFIQNRYSRHHLALPSISLSWDSNALNGRLSRSSTSFPAFYVYDINDGKGFVIISAEDAIKPVIGYSFENPMGDPSKMPDNIKAWLNQVVDAVEHVRTNHIQPTDQIRKEWADSYTGTVMLRYETASWDQNYPYNADCPVLNGRSTIAGCVATGTAIVMRYHKCPITGKGSTTAYTTETYHIPVPARNLEHRYDWANMPMSGWSHTAEQVAAISTLLADIGAGYMLDYGPSTTWGYLYRLGSMAEKFKYTRPSYINKYNYTNEHWNNLIKQELKSSEGPLIYRGADANYNGGHVFVLDGYTDLDFFHINWGWGSWGNGYFWLNNLTPLGMDFSYGQGMFINFHPLERLMDPTSFKYDHERNLIEIGFDPRFHPVLMLDGQIVRQGVEEYGNTMTIHLDKAKYGSLYTVLIKTTADKTVKEFTFDINSLNSARSGTQKK